jgi:hypothetical protein
MCLIQAEGPLPDPPAPAPAGPQPGDKDRARVLKGLTTLAGFVGKPTGRMHDLSGAVWK